MGRRHGHLGVPSEGLYSLSFSPPDPDPHGPSGVPERSDEGMAFWGRGRLWSVFGGVLQAGKHSCSLADAGGTVHGQGGAGGARLEQ